MNNLSSSDLLALREAIPKLETQSFAMSVAARVGMPVEALLRRLPARLQDGVGAAVNKALEQCLQVALRAGTVGGAPSGNNRAHTAAAAVSGAVGGFFGMAGLAVELPVTTTIMLHSIARIARAQGEDLAQPESALACLQVLALGPERGLGRGSGSESAEVLDSAYYATRAALAQATREAAAYVAQKGAAREGAPAVVAFLSRIAARFGLEVSEKAAAQLVPIAGAAGGLTLNILFTQHFQRLAEGHFTVRRLERTYGAATVQAAYERLRSTRAA